jgi:HAD superfamily hydrolase (TIGR01509 family)
LLRALIFDFDGVLVDSEPLILRLIQQMAAQEGWTLSAEEYYRDYLALDDRRIIERLYGSHNRAVDPVRRDELVAWKAHAYEKAIRNGLPSFPGAVEFVGQASREFPLAIASGSLRSEIEYLLIKLGLRKEFAVVVSADDSSRSKPDPEVYLKALARLQALPAFRTNPLLATQCLAIEDAPGGIEAAHAAAMKCLALTHTRPAEELRRADWVCRSFGEANLASIAVSFE